MNKSTNTGYIPGTCNINTSEIAYRRKVGHISVALAVVVLGALLALDTSRWFRLVLLPIFVIAVSCYQQAAEKFCVGYGAAGQHNADEDSKGAVDITSDDNKLADKRKASNMNRKSVLFGSLLTAVTLLIPEF